MRREHSSILIDVLDELAACAETSPAGVHITEVAARANLPHDRLKEYVAELVQAGLLHAQWPPAPTSKGLQFLQCYHAWIRVQGMFGLHPKPAATAQATSFAKAALVTVGERTRARAPAAAAGPAARSGVADASSQGPHSSFSSLQGSHESFVRSPLDEPFVRGP